MDTSAFVVSGPEPKGGATRSRTRPRCSAALRRQYCSPVPFDFSDLNARLDDLAGYEPGNERRRALEDLAADFLSSVTGMAVARRDIRTADGEAQLDILLVNEGREDGLPALQRDVIVECKSQGEAVDPRLRRPHVALSAL